MRITAEVSIVPVQISIEVPDDTPTCKIRDRIIEQARAMIANNGASHVILASSQPDLVDSTGYLADLGFPALVEYIPIEPPEPDLSELAEAGVSRTYGRRREEEDLRLDVMPDWRD